MIEQLKKEMQDFKAAIEVTDFDFQPIGNHHGQGKPITYEMGEFRITGTPSTFNRIFAEVVNEMKEQIVKQVTKRAREEWKARKGSMEAQATKVLNDIKEM